jgi:YesN/AraC family two-component response regulator
LCDTAVPVRMGDQLIGFLTTGQVFRKKPTEAQFKRTARLLAGWGMPTATSKLRAVYFDTRVLSSGESQAVIKLLTIFAQHLSLVSNQVFLQDQNHELPAITLAKQFIQEHQAEKITLNQVAKAVNMSRFNFCKTFSKAVGIHFTDYLVRLRIERAKNLLLNPNLRVSEIAFEAGFQSLTHFNRVFKKLLGQSPTDYREQLLTR